VLTIDRTASEHVAASPARCLARLAAAEEYPSWSSLIRSAERAGELVRLRAELLGVSFVMDCELKVSGERALLRRLPYDDADEERFEATWTATPAGSGTHLQLRVVAAIDAPGPARLLRGRVERRLADDLLADFTRGL
jgi:hypothetical protein